MQEVINFVIQSTKPKLEIKIDCTTKKGGKKQAYTSSS